MGLSIRGYAAHRGVSHTSVRKAIASGRLTLEPDGTVDPVKADRDWHRNADPSKERSKPKLRPVPEQAIGAVRDTLFEAGSPMVGGMSYLQLRREKSEVVDREEAIRKGFEFARRLRDAWLGWPSRVSALIAAETGADPHKLEAQLTHHVRDQLLAVANEDLGLDGRHGATDLSPDHAQ